MNKYVVSDQELVNRYINGDTSSIEALIKRHKNKVYTYIYLNVRNQALAEDIFQDTFIKVIKSLLTEKYQDNGKFLSWVLRIAHNLIIDYYRKEKQMRMISNDSYDFDILNSRKLTDRNIEENIIDHQISGDLRKLIYNLPEDQREVVILRHFMDMSFKEIAEQTNVSINTALGRMRYAIINLRKIAEEKEITLIRS